MAGKIDDILKEAELLSVEERQRLIALLEARARAEEDRRTIKQLMAEQGTRPRSFEELLGEPGILEDENIDEFLTELALWRSQQSSRRVDE